jgi:hypothetical protein
LCFELSKKGKGSDERSTRVALTSVLLRALSTPSIVLRHHSWNVSTQYILSQLLRLKKLPLIKLMQ